MSLTVEQMEFLQDRGLSLSDVIEFARLNPKAPRSANAERQARHRQRVKEASTAESVTECVTNNVTDNATSNAVVSLSLPPNEINSNPPTHTREKQTPARKGTRLPAEWEPKPLPADLAKATSHWPEKAIPRELSRFRDWAASATGPNAVKSDWDAAWRNWLRKAEDEGRYGKPRLDAAPANDVDPLMRRVLAHKARETSA